MTNTVASDRALDDLRSLFILLIEGGDWDRVTAALAVDAMRNKLGSGSIYPFGMCALAMKGPIPHHLQGIFAPQQESVLALLLRGCTVRSFLRGLAALVDTKESQYCGAEVGALCRHMLDIARNREVEPTIGQAFVTLVRGEPGAVFQFVEGD
ncbi:MAG TPA: hypothetical protein VM074_11740 [Solimonas sp.]|nr:hypothetical protein [Solimonas sp.]